MSHIVVGRGWVISVSSSIAKVSNNLLGTILDPEHGRFDFIAFNASLETSHRGKSLLLGNEVAFQLEDRGEERSVLLQSDLVSDDLTLIKKDSEKLKLLLLMCDVWYTMLHEKKPYPETKPIFRFIKEEKHAFHLVVVHLIHLLQSEGLFPDWGGLNEDQRIEYFLSLDLPHWRMGQGSWHFLLDAMKKPLDYFLDKVPSPSVLHEIMTLLKAIYRAYTGKEMYSL